MGKLTLTRLLVRALLVEAALIYSLFKIRQYAVALDERVFAALRLCRAEVSARGGDILACEQVIREVRATTNYELAILNPLSEAIFIALPLWVFFEVVLYAANAAKRERGV